MNQVVATTGPQQLEALQRKDLEDFVTFFIKDQMFGIPVLKVQDILTPDRIAPIPLAPPEVEGSINLRGRIVTVIDMRERLGLGHRNMSDKPMGVTVSRTTSFTPCWWTRWGTWSACPPICTRTTRARWIPCGGNSPSGCTAWTAP